MGEDNKLQWNIIIRFLLFTFIFTWGTHWFFYFWLFYSPILPIISGLGPALGAFFAVANFPDKGEFRSFLRRVFKIPSSSQWVLFAILVPIGFVIAGIIITYFNNGLVGIEYSIETVRAVIPIFLLSIIWGGVEEIGWRGLLLPQLRRGTNDLVAATITGIFWWVWHLPMYIYNTGSNHAVLTFFISLLPTIGLSFYLSWIYIHTENVVLCILFHAVYNTAGKVSGLGILNQPIVDVIYSLFILFSGVLLFTLYPVIKEKD